MKNDAIESLLKNQMFSEINPDATADDLTVIYDTDSESLVSFCNADSVWLWRKAEGWAPVYLDMDNLPDEGNGSYFADNPDQYEKMFGFLWDDQACSVYRDRAAIFVA